MLDLITRCATVSNARVSRVIDVITYCRKCGATVKLSEPKCPGCGSPFYIS